MKSVRLDSFSETILILVSYPFILAKREIVSQMKGDVRGLEGGEPNHQERKPLFACFEEIILK